MIRFKQVSKTYINGQQALFSLDFHVRTHEMVFLTGTSGAGKSTLLKLIYGIEQLSTGHILFSGYDISRLRKNELPFLRRRIGMIFQDYHLVMDRTVYDNVAMPLVILSTSIEVINSQVYSVLDQVGLLKKARHFPIQLSSEEKQRISIARAIVNKPTVLLADEPNSNLDYTSLEGIFHLFKELNLLGMTIIMVTHNIQFIKHRNYQILTLSRSLLT